MTGSFLGALALVVVILASDAWVGWDATRRDAEGDAVVASIGPVTLDRPIVWLVGCLLLWVFVFPLYLVARRQG